ncbi:hypothetical protein BV25DRAFT_1361725 [Artomyces pyxidatus]|uniref:Uncharacterized protein n=1 Tax=Artomyces pyxidatus TaxID=48021 RepID=A0ACB8SMP4_9AGAM|nr:hypothetical protein BV25DRAFT_1361725 [Artomyces pyxidatus]
MRRATWGRSEPRQTVISIHYHRRAARIYRSKLSASSESSSCRAAQGGVRRRDPRPRRRRVPARRQGAPGRAPGRQRRCPDSGSARRGGADGSRPRLPHARAGKGGVVRAADRRGVCGGPGRGFRGRPDSSRRRRAVLLVLLEAAPVAARSRWSGTSLPRHTAPWESRHRRALVASAVRPSGRVLARPLVGARGSTGARRCGTHGAELGTELRKV